MKSKEEIRKLIKLKREELGSDEKNLMDASIFDRVINSDDYKKAKCIFVYVSLNNEVYTHSIIKHALENNKFVCVPKVLSLKEGLIAVNINGFGDLKSGILGILEPQNIENKIDEEDIDLVLVPGIAFDLRGGRVGYGGGFYDRVLRKLKKETPKTVLCYEFQILSEIPMEENDEYIDSIITEKSVYHISK